MLSDMPKPLMASIRVEICPYMRPGSVLMVGGWQGGRAYVRHMSEFLLWLRGTAWHPSGHCPTWTDATECRCMVEGAP